MKWAVRDLRLDSGTGRSGEAVQVLQTKETKSMLYADKRYGRFESGSATAGWNLHPGPRTQKGLNSTGWGPQQPDRTAEAQSLYSSRWKGCQARGKAEWS